MKLKTDGLVAESNLDRGLNQDSFEAYVIKLN